MSQARAQRFAFAGVECIPFQQLERQQIQTILEWRNDDRVRRFMTNDTIISLEDHLRFVEELRDSEEALYFGVFTTDILTGVIYFTNLDREAQTAQWGYYRNPNITDVTLALRMIKAVEHYFFEVLDGRNLHCTIRESNERAIGIVEAMGYELVSLSSGFANFRKPFESEGSV